MVRAKLRSIAERFNIPEDDEALQYINNFIHHIEKESNPPPNSAITPEFEHYALQEIANMPTYKNRNRARMLFLMIDSDKYPLINWHDNGWDWVIDVRQKQTLIHDMAFMFEKIGQRARDAADYFAKLRKITPHPTEKHLKILKNHRSSVFSRGLPLDQVRTPYKRDATSADHSSEPGRITKKQKK